MDKICENCGHFTQAEGDVLGRCGLKYHWMGNSHTCDNWKAKENEPLEGEKLNNTTEYEEYVKPPLGLTPAFTVYEPRLQAIEEAIERYVEAGKDIPFEWLKEKSDLIKYFIKEEKK